MKDQKVIPRNGGENQRAPNYSRRRKIVAIFANSPIKQKSGKILHAWAFAGDCDPASIRSNPFSMEWPPHSGRAASFPEVDRAAFFNPQQARIKINPAQVSLLQELQQKLAASE
jgi:predicted NUDIX family NTP pyrophosphohydrolase